jgi:hypothetical protein
MIVHQIRPRHFNFYVFYSSLCNDNPTAGCYMIRAIENVAVSKLRRRQYHCRSQHHTYFLGLDFGMWMHFGILSVSSVNANFMFVISYLHGLLFNVTCYIILRKPRPFVVRARTLGPMVRILLEICIDVCGFMLYGRLILCMQRSLGLTALRPK